jgi:hypothetical protein
MRLSKQFSKLVGVFKEFSWQTKYLQKSAPYENIHLVTVSQEDISKEHGIKTIHAVGLRG